MEEIYWITRMDNINVALAVFLTISTTFIVISIVGYFISKDLSEEERTMFWSKVFKYTVPTSLILTLLLVFIPTTKEALMIYGVGGTLDYVQSNEKI